jgi:hypothetical protein
MGSHSRMLLQGLPRSAVRDRASNPTGVQIKIELS